MGIVGCGAVVHAMYAKALVGRSAYNVEYVCDLDPRQAASCAKVFDAEPVDMQTLAERSDAIVVTTPPSSHGEIVRACLGKDRTILCEKPFTTSYADACEIVDKARSAGSRLFVGHFRRAFPQLELARRLVELGLIGEVTEFTASEGGRLTWRAVSNYLTRDRAGGVLWDTGSHTLDMVLFGAGLDTHRALRVLDAQVARDKPEPSHDFSANFAVAAGDQTVRGHLHLSRKEALPGFVTITGTTGSVAFVVGLDQRVRLSTARGSTVLVAERSHQDLLECFDLQLQRVLLSRGAGIFAAEHALGQIQILESLAHA